MASINTERIEQGDELQEILSTIAFVAVLHHQYPRLTEAITKSYDVGITIQDLVIRHSKSFGKFVIKNAIWEEVGEWIWPF